MRVPGRFEWKILTATLLIAVLSVGTSAYVVYFAAKRFFVYADEHQRQVGGASAKAAELFRTYFSERKEEFRRRAEALAAREPLRAADAAREDGLLRARLLEGTRVIDAWAAPADVLARSREAPPVTAALSTTQPEAAEPRVIELTFGIPDQMYRSFLELRQAIDQERELDRAFEAVALKLPGGFVVALISILAIAPLGGLLLARRATSRLAKLSEAARKVGAGDLSVRLAPTGRDELDDLGRAFDAMVEELTAARARLSYLQKVSAWQEVARRLAHEIKNPLTPIQLAVQELASKYRGDDAGYRKLLATATEILHEEITVLRRLVDDFSAFAKLSRAEPEPTDLGNYVAEWTRQHPEWQDFVTAVPATAPAIGICDRVLFRRVLANLVENAVQAVQATGRTPQITLRVEARPQQGRVALLIDDNGPGVPLPERQRIFDPYVTFREGGTGLGLAIVRKIVIDHGGDVSVVESPAGGARFVIELPEAPVTAREV